MQRNRFSGFFCLARDSLSCKILANLLAILGFNAAQSEFTPPENNPLNLPTGGTINGMIVHLAAKTGGRRSEFNNARGGKRHNRRIVYTLRLIACGRRLDKVAGRSLR